MLNRAIKYMLGYDGPHSDLEIVEEWTAHAMMFGKPCLGLAWCPYDDETIEQPLISLGNGDGFSRNELLDMQEKIDAGEWSPGHSLWTECWLEGRLEQLDDPRDDEEFPACIDQAACGRTGRLCPAFIKARPVMDHGAPETQRFEVASCECCGELFLDRVCD